MRFNVHINELSIDPDLIQLDLHKNVSRTIRNCFKIMDNWVKQNFGNPLFREHQELKVKTSTSNIIEPKTLIQFKKKFSNWKSYHCLCLLQTPIILSNKWKNKYETWAHIFLHHILLVSCSPIPPLYCELRNIKWNFHRWKGMESSQTLNHVLEVCIKNRSEFNIAINDRRLRGKPSSVGTKERGRLQGISRIQMHSTHSHVLLIHICEREHM